MRERLVIGARGSALSRRQAGWVREQLSARHPGRRFECVAIASQGDRQAEASLASIGGEGIFVKELEAALTRGEIDLAVHSLKDLPLAAPAALCLAAVTAREDARDAFISRAGAPLLRMAGGSRIGTSSPRRRSQVLHARRDLVCEEIRGNVDTRLRKLDERRYDAIVLAAAGLIRLGLAARITEHLGFDVMLPEPGQGALAIEARADDAEACGIARALHEETAAACVAAERAFLGALGGGCRVPIAAYAEPSGGQLLLRGAVIALDGSKKLEDRISGPMSDAESLGKELAERLFPLGARELLR